jgi:glucan phosphoethanolaminetransferase (alkaline phosphatase superfamily)
MSRSRLYDKAMTIFGATMIFFYFGLAYLLLFTPLFSQVELTMRVIFSIPLFLYGSFRTVVAYQKIKENFFETDDE